MGAFDEPMLQPGIRYEVLMSATAYSWAVHRLVRPIVDGSPSAWPHQEGRLAYGRVESLFSHLRQVREQQQGRIVRLAPRDAQTLLGLLEAAQDGVVKVDEKMPGGARSLARELSWRLGITPRPAGPWQPPSSPAALASPLFAFWRRGPRVQVGPGVWLVGVDPQRDRGSR